MMPPMPLSRGKIRKMLEEQYAIEQATGHAVYKRKKFCKRGHPRTPDNLYANGACKICQTMRQKAKYQVLHNLCKRGHKRDERGFCHVCNYKRVNKTKAYGAWYLMFDVPPIKLEAHPGGWKLWLEMTIGRLDGLPANVQFPLDHFKVEGMTVTNTNTGRTVRVPFTGG